MLGVWLLCFYDVTGVAGLSGVNGVNSVAFADIDADGDLDLVCGSPHDGGMLILRNDRSRFEDISSQKLAGRPSGVLGLSVWDMDYDGKPEIIAANAHLGSRLVFLKMQQDGRYEDVADEMGFTGGRSTRRVLILDANCDGFPDILELNTSLINEPGHRLWVFRGKRFSEETPSALQRLSGDGFSGTVCDLNNDGLPDLILSQKDIGTLIMAGTGTGDLKQLFATGSGEYRGIATGDWNRDGLTDVFVGSSTGGLLLSNTGDGFVDATGEAGLGMLDPIKDAAFADMDNDGDPDLLLLNDKGQLSLMCNEGNLFVNRGEAQGLDGISGATSFALGDYDSDGDLDILLVISGQLRLLENTRPSSGAARLRASAGLPGDRVIVFKGDTSWCLQLGQGFNSLSQSAQELFLGARGDSVAVEWACLDRREVKPHPGPGGIIVLSAPRKPSQTEAEEVPDTALKLVPNPAFGSAGMLYIVERTAKVEIRIVEPSGKVVRVLEQSVKSPGTYWAFWDGTDESGRVLPKGVYFVDLKLDGLSCQKKLLWFPTR